MKAITLLSISVVCTIGSLAYKVIEQHYEKRRIEDQNQRLREVNRKNVDDYNRLVRKFNSLCQETSVLSSNLNAVHQQAIELNDADVTIMHSMVDMISNGHLDEYIASGGFASFAKHVRDRRAFSAEYHTQVVMLKAKKANV